MARDAGAPYFLQSHSAHSIGDLKSVSEGVKDTEKFYKPVCSPFGDAASPVPNEIQAARLDNFGPTASRGSSQSSVIKVPRSGAEDADLVALRKHIQNLQAENDDLLSHRAGEKESRELSCSSTRRLHLNSNKGCAYTCCTTNRTEVGRQGSSVCQYLLRCSRFGFTFH